MTHSLRESSRERQGRQKAVTENDAPVATDKKEVENNCVLGLSLSVFYRRALKDTVVPSLLSYTRIRSFRLTAVPTYSSVFWGLKALDH